MFRTPFALILVLIFAGTSRAQLVTEVLTPEQALELLLGDGVVATNITYSGGAEQIGSFNGENCNIGLPSGMVLSTGDVSVGQGPNNSGSFASGGGYFGITDVDLDALDPFSTHNDAAVIEFDFIAAGDSVSFNYVFASEEYPEYVNGVNDIFGFFLSGPGISGPYSNGAINIAVIPGTNDVVSINTVNNGNDGVNGPCFNCDYYVHNGTGWEAPWNTSSEYVQFDGFTVSLTASAAVICGETYHIKIAIADASDTVWDSSVFLEEGSFESNAVAIQPGVDNPPVFLPGNTVLEGCVDGYFTIFQPDLNSEDVLSLVISGTAEMGVDYEDIPLTVTIPIGESFVTVPLNPIYDELEEGTESVTIQYEYLNSCGALDTAIATMFIQNYEPMTLDLGELFICPGTNTQVSGQPDGGAPNYTFEWSTGETTSSISLGEGEAGEYWVSVTDYCDLSVTDDFSVTEPEPFVPLDSISMCLGSESGELVIGGALPYEFDYDEEGLAYQGSANFQGQVNGSYIVEVEDACGQSAVIPVVVENCDTTIPNVFTPNGDSENEFFVIKGIEGFPKSTLIVYNRWGSVIYEDDNYLNKWRGDDAPDGVYYYVFKRSDGENFEGYVYIRR